MNYLWSRQAGITVEDTPAAREMLRRFGITLTPRSRKNPNSISWPERPAGVTLITPQALDGEQAAIWEVTRR